MSKHTEKKNVTVNDRSETVSANGSAVKAKKNGKVLPVLVGWEGEILVGLRHLEATLKCGGDIQIRVITLPELFGMKDADTLFRKAIAPSEIVTLLEKEEERSCSGRRHKDPLGRCASRFGVSVDWLLKAKTVVEAARRDPTVFKPVQDQMDATGRVDAAYRKVQRAKLKATRNQVEGLLGKVFQLADDFEAFVPQFNALKKEDPEMARTVSECIEHGRQAHRVIGKRLNRMAGGRRRGR